MSTADKVCTVILGALALATIALILLQLAAEDTVITVRPLTLPDAITTPAAGVPVSPALHHIADGRDPGPVTGRVAASVRVWLGRGRVRD